MLLINMCLWTMNRHKQWSKMDMDMSQYIERLLALVNSCIFMPSDIKMIVTAVIMIMMMKPYANIATQNMMMPVYDDSNGNDAIKDNNNNCVIEKNHHIRNNGSYGGGYHDVDFIYYTRLTYASSLVYVGTIVGLPPSLV